MFSAIWNDVLYRPLLNALAFLVSVIPGADVGIAIIALTIIVKLILFPFAQHSIESQIKMKKLEPEINKIKQSGKSKEEQARLTMELYKEKKVNPLSGCLVTLIQLPIIFALYYVFLKGINFDSSILYPFVHAPAHTSLNFLGIADIGGKSLSLAILAGVSQYFQAHFMPKSAVLSPAGSQPSPDGKKSFQENLSKSMNMQMKYIFPLVVAFIAYSVSGAVALYWITSNIFIIGQQIYAENKARNEGLKEQSEKDGKK